MAKDDLYSIQVDNIELRKTIKRFQKKVKNLKPLTAAIASLMRSSAIEEFETEGHGEWTAIKVRTRHAAFGGKKFTKKGIQTKRFQKFAANKKILTQSGQLRKSLQSESTASAATVGSNKRYARIHQEGGDAGRNHASKIPARPFLNIRPKLKNDIDNTVEKYFET